MLLNTTGSIVANLSDKALNSITSELLTTLASVTIMDGLALIKNDMQVDVSLMEPQGKILWLSHSCEKSSNIAASLSEYIAKETQSQLFIHSIELLGRFYYLAPIYLEKSNLLAVVALSTNEINSTILLALAHSLGREVSEKLKCHFYLQQLACEPKVNPFFKELNMQKVEKALIIEAANSCNGKVQQMHQVLNMGRTTLWRKLKQYEINIKDYK